MHGGGTIQTPCLRIRYQVFQTTLVGHLILDTTEKKAEGIANRVGATYSENQSLLNPYDVDPDYCEMVIQFGFIVLFAAGVCPRMFALAL